MIIVISMIIVIMLSIVVAIVCIVVAIVVLAFAARLQGKGFYLFTFDILRIFRPRIFESKFRNHCAKKLVGALRKPTSFM